MKYFSVSGNDNNSFFFENQSILEKCSKCGLIINWDKLIEYSANTFEIKNKSYNLSTCWDGPTLVSDRFIDIYKRNKLKGLFFLSLPKSPGFSLIKYIEILSYDYSYNSNIYLKDKCNLCTQWYEVSKIWPIKIKDDDEQKMHINTFYRTDLEFGEAVRRTPIMIATENIPFAFKQAKIKDIYFEVAGRDWISGNFKKNIYK
jgi:hypothetical protein